MWVKSLESRVKSQKLVAALRSLSGPRPSTLDFRLPRSGLTLIELLVVIVIMVTLVAAAIPIMSPANDDRRIRESARSLNTFITGAQTRALASKRPFGIALKRLSQDTQSADDNGVCLEVFYVEQPAPFAGFTANSRAMVAIDNGGAGGAGQVLIRFVTRGTPTGSNQPSGWVADPFPPNLIRRGDVVDIGGNLFRLTDTNTEDSTLTGYYTPTSGDSERRQTLVAMPINDTGQVFHPEYDRDGKSLRDYDAPSDFRPPYYTQPMRYRILRQPTFTSDEPYQMPEGTAIDLRASGVGFFDYFYAPGIHDNSQPVIILFTPEGRIARLMYSQQPRSSALFDQPIVDNIFLMLGKRENIPAPPVGTDPTLSSAWASPPKTQQEIDRLRAPINWLAPHSRWIVLGSQSGRVVTIENAFVDPLAVLSDPRPPFSATPSSEEMRTRQILAAREFAAEMRQLGGR